MKRLIFAVALAFLIGLFTIPGVVTTAHAFDNSPDQAQVAVPAPARTVTTTTVHRYWVEEDRPIVRNYYYSEPEPQPEYYYGPPAYYYEPGFSIGLPFFYFHAG